MILMLEDETERLERFAAVIGQQLSDRPFQHRRSAHEFIRLMVKLPQPELICLDHDLFPWSSDEPDPGDGRDVAHFLAQRQPNCPIVIHSSNAPAAASMKSTLEEANWQVHRVPPLGEDWIETAWLHVVKRLLETA